MKKKQRQELKGKEVVELRQMKAKLVAELITAKKTDGFREVKKQIARLATVWRQKELADESA
jgi:ribosomal protein L29